MSDGAGGTSGTRLPTVPPRAGTAPYRVLFVCTGNICRSPMAEVITRALAGATELDGGTPLGAHLAVSSAGTGPWHRGEPMDERAAAALARGGFADHGHVARQIRAAELAGYDLLVALDRRHRQTLAGFGAEPERLALLRAFDPRAGAAADVPDPYYGDDATFDECRELIRAACAGLVSSLAAAWHPRRDDRRAGPGAHRL